MVFVLVSYCDRNKKIIIPDPGNHIEFLTKECIKSFFFSSNVNIQLTFQMFDNDWDCFVDLESDYVAKNKDKLKLIVTPVINDSLTPQTKTPTEVSDDVEKNEQTTDVQITPSRDNTLLQLSDVDEEIMMTPSSNYMKQSHSVNQKRCLSKRPFIEEDSEDDLEVLTPKRRPSNLELEDSLTDTPSSSSTSTSVIPHSVLSNRRAHEKSLPHPFPLPQNFRYDVEVALQTGQMTRETTKSFFSSVASTMLTFKHYPSREDYTRVAMAIVKIYPFLKSPSGSPIGAIVQTLINRFKEFNRTKGRTRKTSTSIIASKQVKKEAETRSKYLDIPDVPVGEDEHSFIRHNNRIQLEMKKKNKNKVLLNQLVDLSYAMRRCDIMSNTYDLELIYSKYPFLKEDTEQFLLEMGRIFGNQQLYLVVRDIWINELVPKIIDQAEREKTSNSRMRKAIDYLCPDASIEYNTNVYSLCILPYMLPDIRSKADHERIICFCHVSF